MVIEDSKHYDILHPLTGERTSWNGERIRSYFSTYGGELQLAPEVKPEPIKTTTTRKRKKRTNGK